MKRSTRARPSATSSPSQPYCPDAGDLIWIDLNPHKGREQAGRRPALVLSPRRYNQRAGLCILCPITSKVKGYPFEVALPDEGAVAGGVALADQMKSVSWEERDTAFAGVAPAAVLAEVRAKIAALILTVQPGTTFR